MLRATPPSDWISSTLHVADDRAPLVRRGENRTIYNGYALLKDPTPGKAQSFLAKGWKTIIRQVRAIRDFFLACSGSALPTIELKEMLRNCFAAERPAAMQEVGRQHLDKYEQEIPYMEWSPSHDTGKRLLNQIVDENSAFHKDFLNICDRLIVDNPHIPLKVILFGAHRLSFDKLKNTVAPEEAQQFLSVLDRIKIASDKLITDGIYLPALMLEEDYEQRGKYRAWDFQPAAEPPADHPVERTLCQRKKVELPWFETQLHGTELDCFKRFRESAMALLFERLDAYPLAHPGTKFSEVKNTIVANFAQDFDKLYQTRNLVRLNPLNNGKKISSIPHDLYASHASTTIRPGDRLKSKHSVYFEELTYRYERDKQASEILMEGRSGIPKPAVRQWRLNINPNPPLSEMPNQSEFWGRQNLHQ
jgi:hypothetical protein